MKGSRDSLSTLLELQKLVIDLALIDRNHYLAGQQRRENDIEHSFSVALLCWTIVEKYNLELDLLKIFKYSLAHDFVERYAGDVNTFATKAERQKKEEDEKQALARLCKEFEHLEGLTQTMMVYESKGDDESLFVWSVDKMQALIMGELDNWRPYEELNINYDDFEQKYVKTISQSSPYCKQIFTELFDHCKTTYYDRPVA
jgi:putative hydrolase of HD superfamily